MKKILGLDLGTTSIGWAFVNEAENEMEKGEIVQAGVRVVPLSTDEQNDFKKGNSITTNASRTEKRGARRNKFRYQLRRKQLINVLNEIGFINETSELTETGRASTFETYRIRAKAVTEKITQEEFARVLLAINKKRGYKSSRKANNKEEGELVDGMNVAKKLYEQKLTPGQCSLNLLKKDKKLLPDYYRSDLQLEFNKVWNKQKEFHADKLTKEFKDVLVGLNKTSTGKECRRHFEIKGISLKGSRDEKELQKYELRAKAIKQKLDLEELAIILEEINNDLNKASGYLGEISDRSKILFFNSWTVGQYLWKELEADPHFSVRNKVFYRQDYEDEFDAIWAEQAKHYPVLTADLKEKIKNRIIFYQRRLKSQKGLISYCEFESWEQDVVINGKRKYKTVGHRVIPRSSPLFQQFKIWQNINSLVITNIKTREEIELLEEDKKALFSELNWKDKMTANQFLKWAGLDTKEWKINFQHLEGNRTNYKLLDAYKTIVLNEGYDDVNFDKNTSDQNLNVLEKIFDVLEIDTKILHFEPTIEGNKFVQQPSYQLWHLLYSYEDDHSKTGNDSLIHRLQDNFGFKKTAAELMANIHFDDDDYGSLSARAIRKIYPFLEDGLKYSEACKMAGYNHSSSITKLENDSRQLDDKLENLKKNSLRNPVVEKILNQMINVVNAILEEEDLGRPDEIRIELARELKQNAEQRDRTTKSINKATREHEKYREIIKKEFGLSYVSRNDLIRYKLYKELEPNGFKTLYSNTYIKPEDLFSKNIDIEHIIPKARLFDDSFSNKTLETRRDNIEKADETAYDYVARKYDVEKYVKRVEDLFNAKRISYTKKTRLLTKLEDIPEDFLARDLETTAYIAKKAAQILMPITRKVSLTSGRITAKLREDWELIDVLKELNWNKYQEAGLTYKVKNRVGHELKRIEDWSKREDHRHHAMDAITVAFTKPAYIQYLNNLNAKSRKEGYFYGIQEKYIYRDKNGKQKFKMPFDDMRVKAKEKLNSILISHKAKNKVTTKNLNRINVRGKNKFVYQTVETPRGQLHKETIYGQSKYYETKLEKIGAKFDKATIERVANKKYRKALLERLKEFDNSPKKAFTGKNSLKNNPIYVDIANSDERVSDKVKLVWLDNRFTIRKEIVGSNPTSKQIVPKRENIKNIADKRVREVLIERLENYDNDPKRAFSILEENPIYYNKEKNIIIKSITYSGVKNAVPLHNKKNHLGEVLMDNEGNEIPTDFISTGNNHHVAIYRDGKGDLQEEVVSFFEAVARKNAGIPIIDKNHSKGWKFLFTMKQNEMFVLPSDDFNPSEIDLLDPENKELIGKHLFRVQKFSEKDYTFRHHLETNIDGKKELRGKTFERFRNPKSLEHLIKVRLNHLGNIVELGEY